MDSGVDGILGTCPPTMDPGELAVIPFAPPFAPHCPTSLPIGSIKSFKTQSVGTRRPRLMLNRAQAPAFPVYSLVHSRVHCFRSASPEAGLEQLRNQLHVSPARSARSVLSLIVCTFSPGQKIILCW